MSEDARLLDSSVMIRHFRQGGSISQRLLAFATLYISSIVLGELYSGAACSARPAKNLGQIQTLLEGVIVLTVDEETARHFGEISSRLAEAGSLIPQNDMWIAAGAMQWGLTLASADAHFSRIEGLKLELWC